MNQYAIFYSKDHKNMRLDLSAPFGIAEIINGKVNLTGKRDFINQWRTYFGSSPAWKRYMATDEPFVTMASKASMGQMVAYSEKDGQGPYDAAKAALTGEIITITVGPEDRYQPKND